MSDPTPTPRQPAPASSTKRNWLPIVPIVGGVLLLMAAAALILSIVWRSLLSTRSEANPGVPLVVTKLTPTPFASPLPPSACEAVISSGDVQMAVPLPISLSVGSRAFPVTVVARDPQGYPEGSLDSAAWVCGTVVNYVVGLAPAAENEALLVGLRPGDEVRLLLSSGVTLRFRFVEQREVATYEAGIFDQFRPRLTLVLRKTSGAWQVAAADYVAATEPVQPPAAVAQPGQPVRLGDAQVTVIRGHAERDVAGLAPGTMVYLVEFTVENVGAVPLDADAFGMELRDGVGSVYLLSRMASARGDSGPLSGEIAPGAKVQGSAGYVVPDALAGPTLTWTFSLQSGPELRASVSIPYEAAPSAVEAGQAQVSVTDAFLSNNGAVLVIEGEVQNVGNGPLTVELDNVSLSSSAGMGYLRMAAPPLPWVIQPGQSQIIELQYDKPAAPAALLTLMGFSFEIGGLQ